MRKIIKRTALSILILLAVLLLFILSSAISAIIMCKTSTDDYYSSQLERMASLEQSYAQSTDTIDYNEFTNFDTADLASEGNPKLNDLRVIGTHNSYKQGLNSASKFFFNYIAFFIEGENGGSAYEYNHETLTSQLSNGIRSFELDMIKIDDGETVSYQSIHNALMDNKSSAIDLSLALKEIAMWSEHNSDHMPITIMIECKPKLAPFIDNTANVTTSDLHEIEVAAKQHFGDSLWTPAEMLGDNANFTEMTSTNDYPSLETMRGKVMLLLHDGTVMEDYIDQTHNTPEQVFFPFLAHPKFLDGGNGLDYTCFALANSVRDTETLDKLTVELNLIIRSRIDSYPLKYTDVENVMASRSQILSSDYPPRTTPAPDGDEYVAYIKDNATIVLSI